MFRQRCGGSNKRRRGVFCAKGVLSFSELVVLESVGGVFYTPLAPLSLAGILV